MVMNYYNYDYEYEIIYGLSTELGTYVYFKYSYHENLLFFACFYQVI